MGRAPVMAQNAGVSNPFAARTFAAVIFDMDGTLIDSTPAVARSWLRWATEYDIPPEKLLGHHGVPAESIVSRLLPGTDTAAALARIGELELSDLDGVVPLPGAVSSLSVLGPRAAIATSCTAPLADARLRAAGITRPEVLVTVDDVQHGKPAPDPFLAAARGLGVDPEQCLVVEDAPQGLIAARAAGCATLAVVTTTAREELQADLVVDNLAAVTWQPDEDGITLTA